MIETPVYPYSRYVKKREGSIAFAAVESGSRLSDLLLQPKGIPGLPEPPRFAGPYVTGYACVFGVACKSDRGTRRVLRGAFAGSLASGKEVHCLVNHQWREWIGSTHGQNLALWEDQHGLRFALWPWGDEGSERAFALVRRGAIVGCSFDAGRRSQWHHTESDGVEVDDLVEADLLEVSLVDAGHRFANQATRGTVRLVETDPGLKPFERRSQRQLGPET